VKTNDFDLAQYDQYFNSFCDRHMLNLMKLSSDQQAIALHAQELGLIPLIRQNELVDSIIRSLCALALLPVTMLVEGLESITERCNEEGLFDRLEPMLNYVLDTWFRPDFMRRLSVYGCSDRTTNACESVNATLASTCFTKKPAVYTFLRKLF